MAQPDDILRRDPLYTVDLWLSSRNHKRGKTKLKYIRQDYITFCLDHGYQPIGKHDLTKAMALRNYPTFRYQSETYYPISVV